LICNAEGCPPVAIEVFAGNTGDPKTLGAQIEKVRKQFGLRRLVIVGDRGLITSKQIDDTLRDEQVVGWITALRADNIKKLASQGQIQMSLFDEQNLAEITSEDYPGERLVVCRNPDLADKRKHRREQLLISTEKELEKIVVATSRKRSPLRGLDKIGVRLGKVLGKYNVDKHFQLDIREDGFGYKRDTAKNRVRMVDTTTESDMLTQSTPLQQRVFELPGVKTTT
jgi:hypothetical protein